MSTLAYNVFPNIEINLLFIPFAAEYFIYFEIRGKNCYFKLMVLKSRDIVMSG